MGSTVSGGKFCCQCGVDVATSKRMKDSSGKYWCLSCGSKDQQKKADASGAVCVACGDLLPVSKLTKISGQLFCGTCVKARARGDVAVSKESLASRFSLSQLFSSGDEDNGETKKKLIYLAILVVAIIGVNYFLHRS